MDQSLLVDECNEPRPDVVVVGAEHYGSALVPAAAAVLVVEIISFDSTFRDLLEKAHTYARAGIATLWVIEPRPEQITLTEMVLSASAAGEYEIGVHTADVFTTERPWSVTIDLPALTARRTALFAAAASTHCACDQCDYRDHELRDVRTRRS